eukprot:TRINITY_DN15638_c0_g1_i1.p2 TRINITY_DN15638_c0_g1~~TRINITY_DN15638_c0_g1_i1.p2  ORF type:complete len:215 (+),score=97.18 TRINITY_DN15638_c0_g1_i1:77-721(+)
MADVGGDPEEVVSAPHLVEEEEDVCGAVFEGDAVPAAAQKDAKEYRVTSRGGKINVSSVLIGLTRITMKDHCVIKKNALLRADLCAISIGSYCSIGERALLRPMSKKRKGAIAYLPLKLSNYVYIGDGAHIEAASIGTYAIIGENAVLGNRCAVRSCVVVEKGAVVPPDVTLPSYTRWAGDPAVCVGQLHEGAMNDIKLFCKLECARLQLDGAV